MEKQTGKGSSDRSIMIKGSAEATRQAHAWIQEIIKCPEKEMSDIMGKGYRAFQQQVVGATPTPMQQQQQQQQPPKPPQPQQQPQPQQPAQQQQQKKQATVKQQQQKAEQQKKAQTKQQQQQSNGTPVIKASGVKATSFAAVASGNAAKVAQQPQQPESFPNPGFGMIATGSHPGLSKSQTGAKQQHQAKQEAKQKQKEQQQQQQQPQPLLDNKDFVPFRQQETVQKSSDYSPFGGYKLGNWGGESGNGAAGAAGSNNGDVAQVAAASTAAASSSKESLVAGFAGGVSAAASTDNANSAIIPPFSGAAVSQEKNVIDAAKAPGYRGSGASPKHQPTTSASNWQQQQQQQLQLQQQQPPPVSAPPPADERCNSAPGLPQPIGPPKTSVPSSNISGLPHDLPSAGLGFGAVGGHRSLTPDSNELVGMIRDSVSAAPSSSVPAASLAPGSGLSSASSSAGAIGSNRPSSSLGLEKPPAKKDEMDSIKKYFDGIIDNNIASPYDQGYLEQDQQQKQQQQQREVAAAAAASATRLSMVNSNAPSNAGPANDLFQGNLLNAAAQIAAAAAQSTAFDFNSFGAHSGAEVVPPGPIGSIGGGSAGRYSAGAGAGMFASGGGGGGGLGPVGSNRLTPSDYMRIQTPTADYLRAPPAAARGKSGGFYNSNAPPPPRMANNYYGGSSTAAPNPAGNFNFAVPPPSQQPPPHVPPAAAAVPSAQMDLTSDLITGRSLQEISDMLGADLPGNFGVPPPAPGAPSVSSAASSSVVGGGRSVIGAERNRAAAMKPQVPSTPWMDLSYPDNDLTSELGDSFFSYFN